MGRRRKPQEARPATWEDHAARMQEQRAKVGEWEVRELPNGGGFLARWRQPEGQGFGLMMVGSNIAHATREEAEKYARERARGAVIAQAQRRPEALPVASSGSEA